MAARLAIGAVAGALGPVWRTKVRIVVLTAAMFMALC